MNERTDGGGDLAAAILDIDGTLVDTNYHHAVAWFRAFRRLDVTLPLYRIHRQSGMGGDQLVEALAGEDFEAERGDDVRELEGELLHGADRRGGLAVMVGDSTWDCEAAKRAGLDTVAVLTGGFSEQELRSAGAVCVFERLAELPANLASTPLSPV